MNVYELQGNQNNFLEIKGKDLLATYRREGIQGKYSLFQSKSLNRAENARAN